MILTAVEAGLTDSGTWPQLAQALAAASKGDAKGVYALADTASGRLDDGTYANRLDARTGRGLRRHEADLFRRTDQRADH